jgi:UrcA family protein
MKTQNIVIQAAAALIAFTCFGKAAQAAQPAQPATVATSVVNFADLNVDAPQGADRLYRRIVAAARHVCGNEDHLRAVADQVRAEMCTERSIEHAVATVNQPALTALLAARTGRTVHAELLANRR